jgi:hypothetical protein
MAKQINGKITKYMVIEDDAIEVLKFNRVLSFHGFTT